jgi:2-polyprenyl-6-methoxyphenol hydroxylase-like FAD-dependent oxidoreductase
MSGCSLQVAVVGGSIAGCCAAVELARSGHDVTIFERSPQTLVGHGAGIGALPTTLATLVERDLVDRDMPAVAIREHVFAADAPGSPRTGREALRLQAPTWSLNWADLHANLRRRIPDARYRAGVEVLAVADSGSERPALTFADGATRSFDLVVFADGHASLGRRAVCPEVEPSYRDYVLWRGVLDSRQLADAQPLYDSLYRISYGGLPGHAIAYRMPGAASPAADGGGLVNFGCYLPVTAAALPDLLVDRSGRRHTSSLAAGELRLDEELRFQAFAQQRLPPYFGELIAQARDTFVQAVFSARLPRHRSARLCVIGDAGTLVQPLTGSGVLKANAHVIDLARALREATDLNAALEQWDRRQTAFGDALFQLGAQMEQASIWHMVDFAELDAAATLRWWQSITNIPRKSEVSDAGVGATRRPGSN